MLSSCIYIYNKICSIQFTFTYSILSLPICLSLWGGVEQRDNLSLYSCSPSLFLSPSLSFSISTLSLSLSLSLSLKRYICTWYIRLAELKSSNFKLLITCTFLYDWNLNILKMCKVYVHFISSDVFS